MKRVLMLAVFGLVAVILVLPTGALAAGGSATGELEYVCPFTVAPTAISFTVTQTGESYEGIGTARVAVLTMPTAFDVDVHFVRIDRKTVYFAGPVFDAVPAGLNGSWWYFAAQRGSAEDDSGGALGRVVKRNGAWDDVATGNMFGVGLQSLEAGWVKVTMAK